MLRACAMHLYEPQEKSCAVPHSSVQGCFSIPLQHAVTVRWISDECNGLMAFVANSWLTFFFFFQLCFISSVKHRNPGVSCYFPVLVPSQTASRKEFSSPGFFCFTPATQALSTQQRREEEPCLARGQTHLGDLGLKTAFLAVLCFRAAAVGDVTTGGSTSRGALWCLFLPHIFFPSRMASKHSFCSTKLFNEIIWSNCFWVEKKKKAPISIFFILLLLHSNCATQCCKVEGEMGFQPRKGRGEIH